MKHDCFLLHSADHLSVEDGVTAAQNASATRDLRDRPLQPFRFRVLSHCFKPSTEGCWALLSETALGIQGGHDKLKVLSL